MSILLSAAVLLAISTQDSPQPGSTTEPRRAGVTSTTQTVYRTTPIAFEQGSIHLTAFTASVRQSFAPSAGPEERMYGRDYRDSMPAGISTSLSWNVQLKPELQGRWIVHDLRIDAVQDEAGVSLLRSETPADAARTAAENREWENADMGSPNRFWISGSVPDPRVAPMPVIVRRTTQHALTRLPERLARVRGVVELRHIDKAEAIEILASSLTAEPREIAKGVTVCSRAAGSGQAQLVITLDKNPRSRDSLVTAPLLLSVSQPGRPSQPPYDGGEPWENQPNADASDSKTEIVRLYVLPREGGQAREGIPETRFRLRLATEIKSVLVPFEYTDVPAATAQ
jgi:hypothetical protein